MCGSATRNSERKQSMSRHLMRVNLLALTLPVTLLLLLLMYLVFRDAQLANMSQRRANLRQQAAMINRLPSELTSMAIFLQQDIRLNRMFSKTMADAYETLVSKREISRMMVLAKNFYSTRGYELCLLTTNGISVYSRSDQPWDLQLFELSQETWYQNMQHTGSSLRHLSPWESPALHRAMPYASCFSVFPLIHLTSARSLGLIIFAIPPKAIELYNGNELYALVDSHGNTIASTPGFPDAWQNPPQDQQMIFLEGAPVQLLTYADAFGTWTLILASPAFPVLTSTAMLLIVLGGIISILSILLGRYNGAYIARETRPILETIAQTAEGHLTSRMLSANTHELNQICQEYNRMLSRVADLLSQIEAEEQEKAALSMEALRAQIHPHFLYNTVASIRYLLQVNRIPDADQTLIALVQLLRATFAERGEVITLQRELAFLQSYVDIMAIRYQGSFTFTQEAAEVALSCGVLMWTLQPLVENSITHGFNQKDGIGHIALTATCEENSLVIRLADDGTANNYPRIQAILSGQTDTPTEKGKFNGIGMENIRQRIRKKFGPSYGISAQPNTQGGMTVIMRLPIIHLQEDLVCES